MAIVVDNAVSPLLTGGLSYLAGLARQQQQQQQLEREMALREAQFLQSAQADAARLQLQRDAESSRSALARDQLRHQSRDQQIRQAYAYAGNQLQAAQQAALRQDDIFGRLAETVLRGNQRMEMAGMEMAQGLIDDQQQAEMLEMQADAQLRNRLLQDIPEEIQQGLRSGTLRYSPDQKTEMKRLESAMARVAGDRSLSPSQRMAAQQMLAENRRQIMLAPNEVPPDERPLTPQQEFDQRAPIIHDQATGRERRITYDRNGVPRYLDDDFEREQASREAKQREYDLKVRQFEWQQEQSARSAQLQEERARESTLARIRQEKIKWLTNDRKAELDALELSRPDPNEARFEILAEDGTRLVDHQQFNQEMQRYQASREEIIGRYDMLFREAMESPPVGEEGADDELDQPQQEVPVTLSPDPQAGLSQWNQAPLGTTFLFPDGTLRVKSE